MVFVLGSQMQAQKTIAPLRERIDLSGQWNTSLGECRLPGTTDENRLGPGAQSRDNTGQLTRLYPYAGPVTYTRTVVIPQSMVGKSLVLNMERTKPSTLWIDGDSIGSICQLYCAHEYPLPPLSAGSHEVKIRIDNSDSAVPASVHGSHAWAESTQTNWNGILGDFYIEARPDVYINKVNVYPDVEKKTAKVSVTFTSSKAAKLPLTLRAEVYNSQLPAQPVVVSATQAAVVGENHYETTISLGDDQQLWSEFHPSLYRLKTSIGDRDEYLTTFGVRKFETEGTQFVINGCKTFLRGTHDACVFPLTAYCPTDVYEWQRTFRIAKAYGINHYRFHSYTPTEAAFIAADLEGIYLQCELPVWGTIEKKNTDLNTFLLHEAHGLIDAFGQHPSFMMMGLGNELWGETDTMAEWLDSFRKQDDRHLYCFGSNNWLGWKGAQDGEDYFVTCRVGGGTHYSTNTRTSFSFADEDDGGILNHVRPNTRADFSHPVSLSPRPIVSHESCQFQIFPDFSEIKKYKGVLYPYNFEVFQKRFEDTFGNSRLASAYHHATGAWAVDCYKADMEYCFRTPKFGGFQLLDIKDYPGQGTALVGILDAFMDSKGLISAKEFRQFCSPVVPMALMDSLCITSGTTLTADLSLCNYEENDYRTPLIWELRNKAGEILTSNIIRNVNVPQGATARVGRITFDIPADQPTSVLTLQLTTGKYSNSYKVWVYNEAQTDFEASLSAKKDGIILTDMLDAKTMDRLKQGAKVLFTPSLASIEKQSVGGLFTPDYWNYAMFKTISENNNKPVSPGTLGICVLDNENGALDDFPNDKRTDWQWWCILRNSRPLILNSLTDYVPIISMVDNIERNHNLGILMEFAVGKGKLMISTTDLQTISQYVEGRQYRRSIINYMRSDGFAPKVSLTDDQLHTLLNGETKIRDIQGVKNETDYKKHD